MEQRSRVSQADSDELILSRGVERESARIALNEQQRHSLNDFYQTFVTPETLSFFDRQTGITSQYGYAQFSGISKAGTMMHVRHLRRSPGEQTDAPLTIVVVGSFDSSETIVLSDISCEVVPDFYGGKVEHIYLDGPAPTANERVVLDELTFPEGLAKQIAGYVEDGISPRLCFERGRWSYERHDGQVEPMSDLTRVYGEVMAVSRKLGEGVLRSVGQPESMQPTTGQFDEKVVA